MTRSICVVSLAAFCMAAGVARAAETKTSWMLYKPVKTVEDVKRALANASAARQSVMVVIRAEWALSSLEMERTTLPDPRVQAALKGVIQLRVDLTENDDEDKKMYSYFNIVGPPAVVFYGADGKEKRNFRGVGFMKAAEFAAVVRQAVAPANKTAP